jgi:hypothetical protein
MTKLQDEYYEGRGYEQYLLTANGKIRCLRCSAKSTRTKLQCGRPAIKISKTQKCQFHGGGKSSGKQTIEGRSSITKSKLRHGQATKQVRQEYSTASAYLNQIEDAMYILGMTTAPRTRGRKPAGYKPLHSVHDVIRVLLDTEKH